MPFTLLKDRIAIGDSILKGTVLGASGRGYINTKSDTLRIEGTFIPIYAIHSLGGKIPILGNILVGRKGEGVFGVTFSMRGTTENPQFSINPVSVLAPGIFRKFFENGTGKPRANEKKKSGPISLRRKPKTVAIDQLEIGGLEK